MIWFSIFVLYTQQHCSLFRLKQNASLTTAHRNPSRAGCCLGVGSGSSSTNTCKMEEGVICFREKDVLPEAGSMGHAAS